MNRPARLMITVCGAGVALLAVAGPAAASPTPNGHNCAGAAVSGLTATVGGIGPIVSDLARAQLVDNLGLANCGQPPRNNP